ncbi:reverse transcriptase [Phytophthora megakarya]|uniref:Reverse transcriptase n=1 Tax=Phytophthora megakarya TaxID=4795 RepID=A0A225W360_9STRA|nr:reverse transcriptase [Phytophthora megakarya]
MIAAESWDQMYQKAEDLLWACDKWNLSISVAKGFWGLDKVGYRGHRVSIGGAIAWSLPGWEVAKARSGNLESLTVNEAEYNGLILGLDMLEGLDRKRLVICGDSNLVIQQVRGEIDCEAPGLTLMKRKALDRLRKWSDHELVM